MKIINFFLAMFFILFGIQLWQYPMEALLTYSLYLGITYVFASISTLIYFLYTKIKPIPFVNIFVSLLLGILIISIPYISVMFIISLFLSIYLFTALYFAYIVYLKKEKLHFIQIAIAILAVLYGFVMLFNTTLAANTLAKIIAMFVILNGVSYLFANRNYTK